MTRPLPYVSIERAPEQEHVIERGGFGGRPAYVRRERDVVLASADLSWIIEEGRRLGLSEPSLDPDRLAAECLLDAGAPGRTSTVYREISEVPPGTRARVTPEAMTLEQLPPPRWSPLSRGERAATRLRELLVGATKRAVDGEAHVGVLTGGGLDSGALLAMAHGLGRRVDAFAIDYAGPGDDRPHLATLARALSVEPFRAAPSEAVLPRDLTAAALPLTWPSGAIEALLLRRAREAGATRVLAGLGADEHFDGDPSAGSMWPRVRRLVPWRLRRLSRRARSRPRAPAWAGSRARRVVQDAYDRTLAERPWVEQSPEERIHASFVDPHLAHASTLRAQLEHLAGIVRVDPYLDEDLAAFALGLAPELLLGERERRTRRGLFREALAGIIPETLRTRADKASFAPVHRALFEPPLHAMLEPYVHVSHLADLGIVEPKVFRRAWEDAARDASHGRLYAVVAVEAFVAAVVP